jgi:hypothetical protein
LSTALIWLWIRPSEDQAYNNRAIAGASRDCGAPAPKVKRKG